MPAPVYFLYTKTKSFQGNYSDQTLCVAHDEADYMRRDLIKLLQQNLTNSHLSSFSSAKQRYAEVNDWIIIT